MQPLSSSEDTLLSSDSKSDDFESSIKADYEEEKSTKSVDDLVKETKMQSLNSDDVPLQIVWKNVFLFAMLHLATLYGVYLAVTSANRKTILFAAFMGVIAGLGVTAGAHRLWSHRSYKAKFPLRVLLAFMFTIAIQNDIHEWCRDHRVHHKFSETHADPHNARRGFFFSHIGWLMCKKHPDVKEKGKTVDLSDLLEDPIVRFNQKYYVPLVAVCSFILPTLVPMYFWNETLINSVFVATVARLGIGLNGTWLVNSAAHIWGNRPYDVTINPRENSFVIFAAIGEGFHNYHHVFPYDYAASEFGMKYNLTTSFINLMAYFGLAYDRKKVLKSVIEARKLRTGVGSLDKTTNDENGSLKSE